MIVLGDHRERRPGHTNVVNHRPNGGIDDRQRLVGVRKRRNVDLPEPLNQLHRTERGTWGAACAHAADHLAGTVAHLAAAGVRHLTWAPGTRVEDPAV